MMMKCAANIQSRPQPRFESVSGQVFLFVSCFLFLILGQFYEEDVFNISQMLFNVRWEGVLKMVEDTSSASRTHQCTIVHCYKAVESEQMLLFLNIYYDVPVFMRQLLF